MGKYREAFDYFSKALAIDPDYEDAKANLESVRGYFSFISAMAL